MYTQMIQVYIVIQEVYLLIVGYIESNEQKEFIDCLINYFVKTDKYFPKGKENKHRVKKQRKL